MKYRGFGFWMLQGPGWLLFLYLVYAQAIPAFDYELGVVMGTQEPASHITGVGVAFFQGFAFADLVIYIPLLGVGLAAYWLKKRWAWVVLAAALGITVYWPVVCLGAVVAARDVVDWNLPGEAVYWLILPLITLWGAWGLWHIAQQPRKTGDT